MYYLRKYAGLENKLYFNLVNISRESQVLKTQNQSSGQDGGVGRNALPSHTTKRRIINNFKTIYN